MTSSEQVPKIVIGIDDEPSFILSAEASFALSSIARRNNITPTQAISTSVINDNFLQMQVEAGSRLLVRNGDIMRYLEYS